MRSTFPKEGGIQDSGCWALSRASAKTEEAHVFIDYMCQPSIQATLSRKVGTAPTVKRELLDLAEQNARHLLQALCEPVGDLGREPDDAQVLVHQVVGEEVHQSLRVQAGAIAAAAIEQVHHGPAPVRMVAQREADAGKDTLDAAERRLRSARILIKTGPDAYPDCAKSYVNDSKTL